MKFSEKWLREWIDPPLSTQELIEKLTMAGLEVESCQKVAIPFSSVIIANLVSVKPHPKNEKWMVCDVEVGENQTLTVITAAKNVRVGSKVPFAKVGAHLPAIHQENDKIAPQELMGIKSEGMLLAKQELGLNPAEEGIWLLPPDAQVGKDLWEYLDLDDNIIEIDLTPNRGDCLSILGIAREIATLTLHKIHFLGVNPSPKILNQTDEKKEIKLEAPEHCARYIGRIIHGIRPTVTPLWIQEKLRRGDIRCIHPVVDILNYVMLELGQPMHAFDTDKLQGSIHIRFSNQGEILDFLDGQNNVPLRPNTLVIADEKGPQALAGIIGGAESAVSLKTQSVFLESALFTPALIAGKARLYGLHTDSSIRFERGVDPNLQMMAMERASELIVQYCQGQVGPYVEVIHEGSLPKEKRVTLRDEKLQHILGMPILPNRVGEILQHVGCNLVRDDENNLWQVNTPVFRYDITDEIDLIEEVARIEGYDKIPSHMPSIQSKFIGDPEGAVPQMRLKLALVDLGYQEVITYSFVESGIQKILFPTTEALSLLNPISADMSEMRLSLMPGLLGALKYNQNRQQSRLKLFESGLCFHPMNGKLDQRAMLGGIIFGDALDEQWGEKKRPVDFYDIKHDIESLWRMIGYRQPLTFRTLINADQIFGKYADAFHPGQSAQMMWKDEVIGVLGQLSPQIYKFLDVKGSLYVFELCLGAFSKKPIPLYERPSKFPEIRRDIALIVDDNVQSDSLINLVRRSAGIILRDVIIFDVYTGKGIDSGRKSIAMGLILQHPSRTLVDDEVDEIIRAVVTGLKRELSAELRD